MQHFVIWQREPVPYEENKAECDDSHATRAGSKDAAGQMQPEGLESHVARCRFAMFMNMLTSNSPCFSFYLTATFEDRISVYC